MLTHVTEVCSTMKEVTLALQTPAAMGLIDKIAFQHVLNWRTF